MPAAKRILAALSNDELMIGHSLGGIQAYARAHPHLRLELCLLDTLSPDPGLDLQRMIARIRPDGVLASIFWPTTARGVNPRLALVNISDFVRTRLPTVFTDQQRMGVLAAEHLLAQDIPHYAFAAVAGRGYGAELRWRGFRDRLRQDGRTCRLFDDFRPRPVAKRLTDADLRDWVEQLPKPVGIHTVYLNLAVRILWACQELELQVPEEVAVIGGQDHPAVATGWIPTVSAIAIERSQVGFEAMRLLDGLLHGDRPPTAPVLLPPGEVVARQSSDFRGTRDPEVARIRRSIAAHPQVRVKELLAHATLSRRTLERRFERQMQHSLHDEIVAARMAEARRLLRQTALPVTQVARQVGYASYAVFAAAFRRRVGATTTTYRRQVDVRDA
jgi:LacI family transcriptional regulator